jgi:predicted RNA-binding protein YlxR (DUF448 family)
MVAAVNNNDTAKRSERTCAGCGRTDTPRAFLRVVMGPETGGEHEVIVDVGGSSVGRGAHVHPAFDCLAKACKGGFARSFKAKVRANVNELVTQIGEAHDRRVTGLILGARRAGHVQIGTDASCEALTRGPALAVVACDAGSVVKKDEVRRAAAEGRAVVWKDKAELGKLFGRDEVGIFCVTHAEIAREIQEARSRSEACKGREER